MTGWGVEGVRRVFYEVGRKQTPPSVCTADQFVADNRLAALVLA